MEKTRTEFLNFALSLMGLTNEQVTDIDDTDDVSDAALAGRDLYEVAREETLIAYNWPVAKKVAAFTLLEEDPTDDWAYAYTLPSDFLMMRSVVTGDRKLTPETAPEYEIASGFKLETAIDISAWSISGQYGFPHWIKTATAHECNTGDRIYLSGVTGETALASGYFKVTVLSATTLLLMNDDDNTIYAENPFPSVPVGGMLQRVGEAQVLYADVYPLTAEYTCRLSENDATRLPDYPVTYVMAFAYKLAELLSLRLVRDNTKLHRDLAASAESYLRKAQASQSNGQNFGLRPPSSSYVTKRT